MDQKVKQSRRPGITRVSSKHQVTLPVAVLRVAGVEPGDELRVLVDDEGRIVLVRERDPLEDLIGSMPGLERDLDLQALRDEWER